MKNCGKEAIEHQYNIQFETIEKCGAVKMGPTASHLWRNDPRHLCFLLSRYKFCSKVLSGKKNVLEVGCGEAFGMPLVLQTVQHVHGIDFDPLFIEWAEKVTQKEMSRCSFSVLDITKNSPKNGPYDGAYALDFIEHICIEVENAAMQHICKVLSKNAMCILGTPNITASKYASEDSKIGHINLKSEESLRNLAQKYFDSVIIFSMNDEVVHTGYYPMAHYLFAVCSGVKKR